MVGGHSSHVWRLQDEPAVVLGFLRGDLDFTGPVCMQLISDLVEIQRLYFILLFLPRIQIQICTAKKTLPIIFLNVIHSIDVSEIQSLTKQNLKYSEFFVLF